MTFVGAFGSEYVAPCAVGVTNETSNDVARAIEPQLKNLRAVRVLFMAESNQRIFFGALSKGYDMVSHRLIIKDPRAAATLCAQHS